MITKDNWPVSWEEVQPWTEVSEDVYDSFFDAMPLLEWCGGYFQYNEPYTSDLDGNGRRRSKYLTFTKKDGKFWCLGLQFRAEYPKDG